jgi:hypothetical protein
MRPIAHGRNKRLIYAGVGVVALAIPATAAALTARSLSSPKHAARPASSSAPHVVTVNHRSHRTVRTAARRGCGKLFTVNMGEGAANLIYSGTGAVTLHNLKVLGYIERCQRNPAAQGFVRGYDQYQARRHRDRAAAAEAAAVAAAHAAQQQQQQVISPAQQASSVTASAASAGGSSLPACTWQPESGGNPSAVNPSSGAGGYYQITPSTWQAYGGSGAPQNASLAQQTAIAQKIWAAQGSSAWTNC